MTISCASYSHGILQLNSLALNPFLQCDYKYLTSTVGFSKYYYNPSATITNSQGTVVKQWAESGYKPQGYSLINHFDITPYEDCFFNFPCSDGGNAGNMNFTLSFAKE